MYLTTPKIFNSTTIAILFLGFLVLPLTMITRVTFSSPRFGTIVFASRLFGNDILAANEIFVADEEGKNWIRLTNNPTSDDRFPTWSPDGVKIVFVSERDGNKEIYLMDADGKKQMNLSNNPGPDTDPTWSPDGKKTASLSKRGMDVGVFVMDADGKNGEMIANERVIGAPAWSPDGKQIAFDKGKGICVMNTSGSCWQVKKYMGKDKAIVLRS